MAWPDLNVLGSRPLRIWSLGTHRPFDTKILFTSLSIPSIVREPASRHSAPVAASGLNASPVSGQSQCQFSCWKHSGAQVCTVNIRGRRQGSHHRSCTSHQRREPQLFGGSQILHSFPRKTVRLPVKRLARHSSFDFRSANYS